MTDTRINAKTFSLVIDCVLCMNVSDCLYMLDIVTMWSPLLSLMYSILNLYLTFSHAQWLSMCLVTQPFRELSFLLFPFNRKTCNSKSLVWCSALCRQVQTEPGMKAFRLFLLILVQLEEIAIHITSNESKALATSLQFMVLRWF